MQDQADKSVPSKKEKIAVTAQSAKRYHHGALRQALMDAAMAAVEQDGAEKVSLRNLARSLGVSATAPYRHFTDRDSLLTAVAARGFEEFADSLEDSAAGDQSPSHGLMAMGRTYLDLALKRPNLYRLMFTYPLSGDNPEEPTRLEHADRASAVLDRVVEWHFKNLGRPEVTKEAVALAAWSGVHGLALLLMDNRIELTKSEGFNVDALIDQVIAAQLSGLFPQD